jgi:type I restriction enzyme R subunit
MNEAETRAELIDPLLVAAGWGVVEGSRIRREFPIAPGRIEGGGRRGKSLSADYVLSYRNTVLAVVEAKADSLPLTEGVGQAKEYAAKLQLRFTYASNGKGIYAIDMETGEEGEAEAFPTPQELWQRTFAEENAWRDRFASIPYHDKGGRLTTNQGRQACRSKRRSSSTEPPTPTSSTRPASAMPKTRDWANRAARAGAAGQQAGTPKA